MADPSYQADAESDQDLGAEDYYSGMELTSRSGKEYRKGFLEAALGDGANLDDLFR